MRYELKYSEFFKKDLLEIDEYIAADNPVEAEKLIGKIEKAVLSLCDFPFLGTISRVQRLRVRGCRILVVGN